MSEIPDDLEWLGEALVEGYRNADLLNIPLDDTSLTNLEQKVLKQGSGDSFFDGMVLEIAEGARRNDPHDEITQLMERIKDDVRGMIFEVRRQLKKNGGDNR